MKKPTPRRLRSERGSKKKPARIAVNDERGTENLPSLVPPVGHPQRAAALEFLRLPVTALDEDVRRRVGELLRVNSENVGLNAHGVALGPGEVWEPDPAWHEYSARFIDGGLQSDWEFNMLLRDIRRVAYAGGKFDGDGFLAFLERVIAAKSDLWQPLFPLAMQVSPEQNPALHALRRECAQRGPAFERRVARVLRRLTTQGPSKPAGRRTGSRNAPKTMSDEERRMRAIAPQLRIYVREAKQCCRGGRHPQPFLEKIAALMGQHPSTKRIAEFCLITSDGFHIAKPPEQIVLWVIHKHLGVGLGAVKSLIKRSR